MRLVNGEDIEISLNVIRQWSADNTGSHIEWRSIHAAANVLSLAEYQSAQGLAQAKEKVSQAKQSVKQAEAIAALRALGDLLAGRAKHDGEQLPKMSYTAAEKLVRHFVPSHPDVVEAYSKLIEAEGTLTALQQRLDAVKEISQNGKSTARMLTEIA